MENYLLYALKFPNGKLYVGITTRISAAVRFTDHIRYARNRLYRGEPLHKVHKGDIQIWPG